MANKPVTMNEAILNGRDFFESLDRVGFARWLWAGISTLYAQETYAGFAPVDGFMGFGETATDDMETIYRQLVPTEQQPLFRQAIGDALSAHGDDEGDVSNEGLRSLMFLAHRVDAVEIVKVIAHVVGYGLAAEKSKNLLYYAISNLKSFDSSSDLREAMLNLVNSPRFRDNFIFDVMEFLHRYAMVVVGDEAIPHLTARMDIFYRRAMAQGGKGFINAKEDAAAISWYQIPKRRKR